MSIRNRVLIIDMAIERKSPAGSCVLSEVRGLSRLHDVTVLSASCDAAGDPGVRWLRVWLPNRPIFLRYCLFQLQVWTVMHWVRLTERPFDLVQCTQGQWVGAQVAYAHFCHAAYLQGAWQSSAARGLRRLARWLNHSFNAHYEWRAFSRAKVVVVPSLGLKRELSQQYPKLASRIETLANPVDIERFSRTADFDRDAFRAKLRIKQEEIALSFMALGDFARKGLGLIIESLSTLDKSSRCHFKIVVIGGGSSEISEYKYLAAEHGIADNFVFVGMQREVREYLWATDAYAFPSAYEIFSLAILQAAAAGLPVLVSDKLYGAEEFIEDGRNGWVVPRTIVGVAEGLKRIIRDAHSLQSMSAAASASVKPYSESAFQARWNDLLRQQLSGPVTRGTVPLH